MHSFLEKIICRLRRLRLADAYKFMYKIDEKFGIATAGDRQYLLWENKPIKVLTPVTEIASSQSGSCFIIASGPSIKDIPPEFFENYADRAIAVNGATKIFDSTNAFPSFCAATDTDFIINRIEVIERILREDTHLFISSEGLSYVCRYNRRLVEESSARITIIDVVNKQFSVPQIPWDLYKDLNQDNESQVFSEHNPKIGFSLDLSRGFFCGKTITYRAVQIARYLGFETINILGMDLGGGRFYEEGDKIRPSKLEKDYENFILPAFTLCGKVAKAHGFQVNNLSLISRLPDSVITKRNWQAPS